MNQNRSSDAQRRSTPPPRPAAGGFVLVAVLVALVVITLLASAVALVGERAVREARENSEAFEAEVALAGTRDTVLFLFATQRQTFAGLTVDDQVVWSAGRAAVAPDPFEGPPPLPIGNEIRLDNTPYLGLPGTAFSLQDDSGLFSPNWTFPALRPGFFDLFEVPPGDQAELEAKRLDYQDPDDLVRLGGAEAPQYLEMGLPPPTNRTLVTPLETRRIAGWGEALEGYDDAGLMELMTASPRAVINVNTAPLQVLQTLPGVDEATAERIVAMRALAPFMFLRDFLATFNIPLDEEAAELSMLATGSGLLRLWHNDHGAVRVLHWTLTPWDEGGRPWRLDYEITLPRDEHLDQTTARATASPLFAEPDPAGR